MPSPTTLLSNFNTTIDHWIHELEAYSLEELLRQPEDMWSIGQVYVHIIGDSDWYIAQIREAIASDVHAHESMTPNGRAMFEENSFPNERIANPANEGMPQPENKGDLLNQLRAVREEMNRIFTRTNPGAGKSQHPGLGYFTAYEWLQFADMHMRHHQRQVARIRAQW